MPVLSKLQLTSCYNMASAKPAGNFSAVADNKVDEHVGADSHGDREDGVE